MKNSELKGLSLEELVSRLASEADNYSKLKFAHSITPIENPMKIKESRKLIARIKTEIRAKETSK
ncbi:50S ribosomal protein L29 [Marinoscillum sp. MHG1-6]|uniref:50S ribosomal protein L29 n=1 Tax=Marinoscillum sp. MHG1-6 TaxID=2959627 RepID=UPI002158385C|nr:50S ribosomal protein L29 [Marinoscillum sp. MHG1-6]